MRKNIVQGSTWAEQTGGTHAIAYDVSRVHVGIGEGHDEMKSNEQKESN